MTSFDYPLEDPFQCCYDDVMVASAAGILVAETVTRLYHCYLPNGPSHPCRKHTLYVSGVDFVLLCTV